MSVELPQSEQRLSTDHAWNEVERFVERLAELGRSNAPSATFHSRLVSGLVELLAAEGGAVWIAGPDREFVSEGELGLRETGLLDDETETEHARLLAAALQVEGALLVPPGATIPDHPAARNSSAHLLLLSPIRTDAAASGVIEIVQRDIAGPSVRRGYLELLDSVAEIAADQHRRRRLDELQDRERRWERFRAFSERVHASLDVRRTAFEIANEGRGVLDCDRLSVLVGDRGGCRVRAISGVHTVARRSNAVRLLERLVRAVLRADRPLHHAGDWSALPPQVRTPLQAYLEESHARGVSIVPLARREAGRGDREAGDVEQPNRAQRARREPLVGALVAEQFDLPRDDLPARLELIADSAAIALGNALRHRRRWLPRFVRRMLGMEDGRGMPVAVPVLLVIAGLATAACLVPADFDIAATGTLQPRVRHDVFAPGDAVVHELAAGYGRRVRAGEELAALRNPELELESERVAGEMQTARTRLAAIEAARLDRRALDPAAERRYAELASEEQELKQRLASLDQQRAILESQREELTLRSPIDGQVMTWDADRLLRARPVRRGQAVLTVADLAGPWVLELEVPDGDAGHVLDARDGLGPELRVSFLLATDPRRTYERTFDSIAGTTETNAAGEPVVRIEVPVDRGEIPDSRPGASAIARIHCGRRAIGYVWLHGLIDAVRSWLWL
ncbi:MAG: efflux RND transporter periplasmic adaptor subunit [Planctomycetaceae bacterium]